MNRRLLALIAMAALLAAGCAEGFSLQFGGLDVSQLETQILSDLERDLELDLESVECPSGVRPRAGDVFACRVYAVDDDSVGLVEVTQVDENGSVSWELVDVLAPDAQ